MSNRNVTCVQQKLYTGMIIAMAFMIASSFLKLKQPKCSIVEWIIVVYSHNKILHINRNLQSQATIGMNPTSILLSERMQAL